MGIQEVECFPQGDQTIVCIHNILFGGNDQTGNIAAGNAGFQRIRTDTVKTVIVNAGHIAVGIFIGSGGVKCGSIAETVSGGFLVEVCIRFCAAGAVPLPVGNIVPGTADFADQSAGICSITDRHNRKSAVRFQQ